MRALQRNKQTFYYALYLGATESVDEDGYYTGEMTSSYSTPVEARANISPARGEADVELFGITEQYTKTIVTTDMNCPIDTTSQLWIGIPITEPYNYVVVRVAKSLNSITYAIREVSAK